MFSSDVHIVILLNFMLPLIISWERVLEESTDRREQVRKLLAEALYQYLSIFMTKLFNIIL